MKNLILIISIISFSWTQCDANNDGGLDVMDIIVQVNCILEECWEYEEPSESIYGFWMLDSAHAEVTMNDTLLFNDSIYCGQYDEYNNEYEGALVIYFIENNQGGEMNIDHTFKLNYPTSELENVSFKKLINDISFVINKVQPDILYLPLFHELSNIIPDSNVPSSRTCIL